jgi:MFS transporter, DHA1 family, tetracycline resistance protein
MKPKLNAAAGGLLGQIDIRLPFIVGAALAGANVLWGYFVLPESLPAEKRAPFRWRQANPFGALKFLRSDGGLIRLAGVHFFMQLAHQIYPALWVLYTSFRYQWDAMMVGVTLAASGVLSMLVQSFLVAPVVKWVGERMALIIGMMFWALAFTVEGWAPTTFWFVIAIPIGALSSFAGPALSSLLSQRVGADQQGQLQGAAASLTSIGGLIGPLMFTGVFSYAIAAERTVHVPGAPFYIAAAIIVAGEALAATAMRRPATQGAVG